MILLVIGAAVFQSKLFPKNSPSDAVNDIQKKKLWCLTITRTVGIFNLYEWSKVLIDTSKTDIVDIHKIRQMLPGYTIVNADPTIAAVHHYRYYKYDPQQLQIDNYMTRYKEDVLKTYDKLFG